MACTTSPSLWLIKMDYLSSEVPQHQGIYQSQKEILVGNWVHCFKRLNIECVCIGDVQQFQIEYELHPTLTGVCITCTFLDSSTTDCVAVVHQRISQLSSSGLMNIESSRKFTRSGDTASGCIERVNLEQYQVGVMGGRQMDTPEEEGNNSMWIGGREKRSEDK